MIEQVNKDDKLGDSQNMEEMPQSLAQRVSPL